MWDNRSNISEPDQRVKGSCVGSLVVKLIMGPPTSASKVATVSLVAAAASVGIALYVCQQRKGWTLGCPAILSRHVKPRQDETSGGQDDSQAFADIATVDFDVYAHGTAEERQRECDKVRVFSSVQIKPSCQRLTNSSGNWNLIRSLLACDAFRAS